jgi:hypothetical protein
VALSTIAQEWSPVNRAEAVHNWGFGPHLAFDLDRRCGVHRCRRWCIGATSPSKTAMAVGVRGGEQCEQNDGGYGDLLLGHAGILAAPRKITPLQRVSCWADSHLLGKALTLVDKCVQLSLWFDFGLFQFGGSFFDRLVDSIRR